MVAHAALPMAKLAALLMKQISKPIANAVKQGAKSSPVFRKYVCLPPAQLYNWFEIKTKMYLLQWGQPVKITVLNEAALVELGADLLGESVIFLIAAGILLSEYNRSTSKEAAKEALRKRELADLKNAVRDLFIQTEEQAAHIRELTRKLGDIDTGSAPKSRIFSLKDSSSGSQPPEPPRHPPQSPHSEELKEDREDLLKNISLQESSRYKPFKGVIFKALSDIESNFLVDPSSTRQPGILIVALNHLYTNVYNKPVTF